jgi:hypothetical protein
METSNNRNLEPRRDNDISENRSGRVLGGLVLLLIGGGLMFREFFPELPRWLFSWEMIPIAIGLFIGAKVNFRPGGWLIPIFIGTALLIDDIVPTISLRHFIWPAIIIMIGLVMIFRPRGRRSREYWKDWKSTESGEDVLEIISVFAGNKKNIISKNFKGGETVSCFGGTELNLTQADFTGTAVLEMTQVFGGAKLIVPANWRIQSEIVSVFGGLDDKRPVTNEPSDPNKTLKLIGTSVFGGIEIKSY